MKKAKAARTAGPARASASALPPAPGAATSKGTTYTPIAADKAGLSLDEFTAQIASDGIVGYASSLAAFGRGTFGELSLTDCAKVLKVTAQAMNNGDLTLAVTMLSSQAVALNAMFGELARRSALHMGEYLDASERYMRLALKAQGQCRATLETLAAIKNPPLVFARQANINNGGQQQVNNGVEAAAGGTARAGARASKSQSAQIKLLEAEHGKRVDFGAQTAAGRADSYLAPVGAFNRPA